ncbi:reverse transcriptase domain-containing protein [Tanacetum coccineum]
MSTRSSSSSNLIPHFSDPECVIRNRRRNLSDPSLLLDFEEINMNPNNVQGPPPAGPPPQNHNSPPGLNLQMPAPFFRTMEELCQPTMNGRGGPIAPVNIQATDFGLKNHMIQQVQNNYTFYNGLTLRHRDTINAAAGGTFMKRRPEECYDLIENMTAHHNDWDTSAHRGESSSSTTSSSFEIAALAQQMIEMRKDMIQMYRSNQQVNSVTPSCETCGGPHSYYECQAVGGYTQDVYATTGNYNSGGNTYQPQGNRNLLSYRSNNFLGPPGFNPPNNQNQDALPSNTEPNPREQVNSIMTRSGLTTAEPSIPPPVPLTPREEVEKELETFMDEVHITNPTSIAHVPPPEIQPVSPPKPKEDPNLMDALTQIPTYTKVLKDLLKNKQKLEELVNTPINAECFATLLNKVPQKLRDLRKFFIPCVLQDLEVCNSLADSGASINLMPLSIYKKLRIGPLKPTQMTLELANRSVTYPMGIAEDVIVKVDKFNFLADFVIVDFEADPRVPIILGRPFLRTAKALNSPSRERHSGHSINIIDSPCEEISNQDKQSSGSTTSHSGLSFPDYEAFCFDINHQEEKSSGSTTSRSDHSLPDYKAFCFDIDHHEEKSSGSTTSHSDPSLFEYESFYFDLSIDTLPPADRSDYHHEEFTDELAHIISPPEYDHFFFDIKVDPGELTRLLIEISSSKNDNLTEIKEDNELKPKTSTKELTIHELNDL